MARCDQLANWNNLTDCAIRLIARDRECEVGLFRLPVISSENQRSLAGRDIMQLQLVTTILWTAIGQRVEVDVKGAINIDIGAI